MGYYSRRSRVHRYTPLMCYFCPMRFEDGPNVPDHFYRNRLPHFDPKDAPYFCTYRLDGSVPQPEIERLYQRYRKTNTEEERDHFKGDPQRQHFLEFDAVLDANGPYHLSNPPIRTI